MLSLSFTNVNLLFIWIPISQELDQVKLLLAIIETMNVTNEDNMQLMARYPDNYFDLAIVDPPYGLVGDKKTKGGCERNLQVKFKEHQWDDEIPNKEYFEELFRVSKKQIIWGGNYFPYIWKDGCRGFDYLG
jgi:DNA modification methylase